MKKIGSKIYYEKNSGNIILHIGDMRGDVVETHFDQDYENYIQLQKYNRAAIGVIQLEFGEFNKLMAENKANRFKIDVSGKEHKLVFFYVEPETEKETEPPRTIYDDIKDLKKENEELKEKIKTTASDIMEAVIKMNMTANSKMSAEDVPPLETLNDLGIPTGDVDINNLGGININEIPKIDPGMIPPPPIINK